MAAKKRFWIGSPPDACDICAAVLVGIFIDGRTRMGPWANMCNTCHRQYGCGLGTGCGQKYQLQDDGRWMKVAG